MKLVVLGATGGTGLEMVRQSLEHGHTVTALARSPQRLKPFGDRITIIQGDLLNSSELEGVIGGHDAVLSGFGPRVPISKADAHLLRNFAVALTTAMVHSRVRRVAIVSTAFLFKDSLLPPTHLLGKLLFPSVVADASEMEEIFRRSGLEWTIVRPPRLTNRPRKGRCRIRESHLPAFGFTISRADVADFVIQTVEKQTAIRKVVGISN